VVGVDQDQQVREGSTPTRPRLLRVEGKTKIQGDPITQKSNLKRVI
jgi:hypothetical protein